MKYHFRVIHKARELVFQVGLVLLAIVLGKALDNPVGYVIAGILAIAFVVQWILQREELAEIEETSPFGAAIPREFDVKEPTKTKPSLLFVFGVPLGDNDSSTWMMTLTHYGPRPAHTCTIDF